MTTTLVLPGDIAEAIEAAAREPVESGAVLLVNTMHDPHGGLRLLTRSIHWVPPEAYLERGPDRMTIASMGYVGALGQAQRQGSAAIWLHTHPGLGASPKPSLRDRRVDTEIADLFRLRTESPYYGAVIFSPRREGMAFTGAFTAEGGEPLTIDRLWEVGDRWRLTRAAESQSPGPAPIFDRNIRAFGAPIQQTLGSLHIGIVGCGGTGSAVAEQLVRLGVRRMTLIDPDALSESNVTRVYGSTPADVGELKVDVLQAHLLRIAPDLTCNVHPSMVTLQRTAKALLGCDLVFGCTDDNAGRLVLSRLASYLLTPVIDCGVLLSSAANGALTGIDGRVTVLSPGAACLVCRGRIDVARAAAELMTPDERRRLEDEGYAPALGQTEPAVVAYTTGVAAAAINEMLERLIGFGPQPRPSETLLRWHERQISTNFADPRPGHYCHHASGKQGLGAAEPFLEQVWP